MGGTGIYNFSWKFKNSDSWIDSSNFGVAGTPNSSKISFGNKFGYGVDAVIGYHINDMLRLEGEFGYANSRKKVILAVNDQKKTTGSLNNRQTFAFANLWFDFASADAGIAPYFGGGVGLLKSKLGLVATANLLTGANLASTVTVALNEGKASYNFAYQIGAGIVLPFGENWKLDIGYRYKRASATFFSGEKEKISTSSIKAGLRFNL